MLVEERRNYLLRELQARGYLEIKELVERLEVSGATIRRDLDSLAQDGLVERVRGGALPLARGTSLELPYELKRTQYVDEKRRIGRAAAALVEDGDTVILDAGSTTYQVALALMSKVRLTVVTNDLHIALKLAPNPFINLIVTGGITRGPVYTLLGPQAAAFLQTLHVDVTFLGADAILLHEGQITNVNLDEVPVKQAMIKAGRKVVVVTDSSKFTIVGFARVCDLEAIDIIFTDDAVDSQVLERLRELEVDVRCV